MTIQRFQNIVLRLGNQMFVRHYLWLNYPNDPQLMGLEHREYMRGYRPSGRLATELKAEGFQFNEQIGIWTVGREEGAGA